jgi:integrase
MTRRHNGEGSIFPYRNGFAAYAWIVTPDGRRQRKYVYGKSRQAVHDRWLKLVAAARRGPVAPSVPSLRQYLDRWLRETVRPNLAPSTVANYEFFSKAYINPSLGSKRLDRLTVRDVQLWMNDLRERCQCCAQGKDAARRRPRCCAAGKCCRQIASEWTRHQAWTILQSALSAAVREELVSRNVAALVKVSTPRARRTLVWTVDQSRQFLENARGENDPYYVAYVLMLVLGLRRGEVLGLGWDDVDLDAGKAIIAWQLQRVRGQLLRRPTKTAASDSALPLPRICVTALESRRDTERQLRAKAQAWRESHLVLTTPLGTPVDPRNFHRAFIARCRKAGVPVTTVHATRKACASLLVALDVHPRVAMQILRHSQIAVTMDVYSQVTSDATSRALKRLGEELEGR